MQMSNMQQEEYKFPDEAENKTSPENEFEFEIEDDTPPEDRNRKPPLPKEMIDELENDELESYSVEVKSRINKLKKIYHDERREKDQALREQQEALAYAQRILEENKNLKNRLSSGERTFVDTYRTAAELELEKAKREYKDAHDIGDTDLIISAQEKLTTAQYKLQKVKEYVPSLQQEEVEVQPQQIPAPRPDQRTAAWQERNQWFGQDEEMTSLALGLHQKLVSQYGAAYPSTDEYWKKVDDTMRRRFPEYFAETEEVDVPDARIQRDKPSSVVAPATRTTSSKKVVVKKSAVAMAKKLGVPLERYVQEMQKLEARNG
jgi:hypothetical protein